MRVNVYTQELTGEVCMVEKESGTGRIYTGVQMMLESSPRLHYRPGDDDRSAVTFWIPESPERRELLASSFEKMASFVRGRDVYRCSECGQPYPCECRGGMLLPEKQG